MSQYLSEAFKKLDTLNEETFSVTDSGLQDFVKFTEDDEDENIIDIIDVEAETVEDLEDSYIGKVILDCCVCHSKLYKDTEDVVIEDDLANVNEECPFCYANDGYKVVGQVATFGEAEEEETEEKDDTLDEGIIDSVKKTVQNIKNKPHFFSKYKEVLGKDLKPGMIVRFNSKSTGELLDVRPGKEEGDMIFKVKYPDGTIDEYDGYNGDVEWEVLQNPKQESIDEGIIDTVKNKVQDLKTRPHLFSKYNEILGKDLKPGMIVRFNSKNSGEILDIKPGEDGYMNIKVKYDDGTVDESSINGEVEWEVLRNSKQESIEDFDESLNEDINNLSLDTDDTHMEMSSDENGKVIISTEPLNNAKVDENETIAPIEPETQNEIESNVADGEEIEIDVDEFDEESFDELGEGYLKKVYENVNSFKTSSVSFLKDKLILEGVIKFNSGNSKKTNFIFGIREATKSGKVRFIGENREIARGKKSFTITGRVDNKRFLSESFNYNYGVKTPLGKVKRLYGTINK